MEEVLLSAPRLNENMKINLSTIQLKYISH